MELFLDIGQSFDDLLSQSLGGIFENCLFAIRDILFSQPSMFLMILFKFFANRFLPLFSYI